MPSLSMKVRPLCASDSCVFWLINWPVDTWRLLWDGDTLFRCSQLISARKKSYWTKKRWKMRKWKRLVMRKLLQLRLGRFWNHQMAASLTLTWVSCPNIKPYVYCIFLFFTSVNLALFSVFWRCRFGDRTTCRKQSMSLNSMKIMTRNWQQNDIYTVD